MVVGTAERCDHQVPRLRLVPSARAVHRLPGLSEQQALRIRTVTRKVLCCSCAGALRNILHGLHQAKSGLTDMCRTCLQCRSVSLYGLATLQVLLAWTAISPPSVECPYYQHGIVHAAVPVCRDGQNVVNRTYCHHQIIQ